MNIRKDYSYVKEGEYKGFKIWFYNLMGYTFYCITDSEDNMIKDNFISNRACKLYISKELVKN